MGSALGFSDRKGAFGGVFPVQPIKKYVFTQAVEKLDWTCKPPSQTFLRPDHSVLVRLGINGQ
jgi:hypothetical protein